MKETATFTAEKIKTMQVRLAHHWDDCCSNLRVSSGTLYAIIGVKKMLEKHSDSIEQSIQTLFKAFRATTSETGITFPEEVRDEAQTQLDNFAKTAIDCQYEPIIIKSDDTLPIALMDILYDFIKVDAE